MGILKRYKMHLVFSVFVAIVLILSSIQLEVPTDDANDSLISNFPILRIGTVEAAGTVDYTVDGTDDNVQFQAALDALPATGGRIQALSGTYNFSATVSRAIDNVLIEGTGQATIFNNDAATALFSAGSQANWTFRDFATDAGGLTVSSATYWTMQDITIGTDYYAFRTSEDITASDWDIPTGRTATYVIAASDAPDNWKAQADVVSSGAGADQTLLTTAIGAGYTDILLSPGTFTSSADFDPPNYMRLRGSGKFQTKWVCGRTTGMMDLSSTRTGLHVSDMEIDGNSTTISIINLRTINSVFENLYIHDGGSSAINQEGSSVRGGNIYRNNYITDMARSAFRINNDVPPSNVMADLIENNEIYNCGTITGVSKQSSIYAFNCPGIIVRNNYIEGGQYMDASNGNAHIQLVGCRDAVIDGNVSVDSGMMGFWNSSVGIIIINNTIIDSVDNAIDPGANGKHQIIKYNTVIGAGLLGTGSENRGILVGEDTICEYNTVKFIGDAGIKTSVNSVNAKIRNNTVENCNLNGTSTAGIWVQVNEAGTLTGLEISNNASVDNQSGMSSTLTADPSPAQKVITVTDGTKFVERQAVYLLDDDTAQEDHIIDSISGNNITLVSNISGTFTQAQNAALYGRATQSYGIKFDVATGTVDGAIVKNNTLDGNITANYYQSASGLSNMVIKDNEGYIAPGEVRTASGSLSAGANGDIGFSWHNPVPQDCYIKRVVVSVNSAAAAAATGRVGIADDATGTNLGAEFFTAIPLNSTGVYDSYVSGDTGAQTKWIAVQDSASATDGWVCLKIETNDSTATGTYYIEYVGK